MVAGLYLPDWLHLLTDLPAFNILFWLTVDGWRVHFAWLSALIDFPASFWYIFLLPFAERTFTYTHIFFEVKTSRFFTISRLKLYFEKTRFAQSKNATIQTTQTIIKPLKPKEKNSNPAVNRQRTTNNQKKRLLTQPAYSTSTTFLHTVETFF